MKIILLALLQVMALGLNAQAEYYSAREDVKLKDVEVFSESGHPQNLFSLINQNKPVLLIPGYYSCNSTCPLIVENIAQALHDTPNSNAMQVLFLSFRSTDSASDIQMFRTHHKVPENWQLTVIREESAAKELLALFGYQYRKSNFGFDHPNAAFVFSSGEKRWAGILTGTSNSSSDIKKALNDAAFVNQRDNWTLLQKAVSRPQNIIAYAFAVIVLSLTCISVFMYLRRA